MRIEVVADGAALAARAADAICGAARAKPEAHIGLPTGNTPIATYEELARRAASGVCDVRAATAWAVDEFALAPAGQGKPAAPTSPNRKRSRPRGPIPIHVTYPEGTLIPDDLTTKEYEELVAADDAARTGVVIDLGTAKGVPGTNAAFYRDRLRMPFHQLRVPDAAATDPASEVAAFAATLQAAGGLDLCVLGIGLNGHIAFNEPGAGADSQARMVELTPQSREAHAAAFGGIERVPSRGMTLGIADILASAAILVLAQGAAKADIVRAAIEGPQAADVPASWLQRHDYTTWLLDDAAAARLTDR